MRAAAKKTIGRLENSLKKYLKNILKSVDIFQKIWYNIRVERLREKSQSYSDLLIEERERIDPYVHNNPPKILHILSLISPSLKIDHSALQERLRFVLCLVYSYLLLLGKQSVERSAVFLLFFCLVKVNLFSCLYDRKVQIFTIQIVSKKYKFITVKNYDFTLKLSAAHNQKKYTYSKTKKYTAALKTSISSNENQ